MTVRSQIAPSVHTINTFGERATPSGVPTPRHSGTTVKRMVGMLGGKIDRKAPGMSGRVLEQKRSRVPAPGAKERNARATALAVRMARKAESPRLDFRLDRPCFLTADFSHDPSAEKFLSALQWMIDSGVEVIVTLEPWMKKQMQAFPRHFFPAVRSHRTGLDINTHIWTFRNPLNTTNEQLSNSITKQFKRSQKLC